MIFKNSALLAVFFFFSCLNAEQIPLETTTTTTIEITNTKPDLLDTTTQNTETIQTPLKEWTIILYIAANNNLARFVKQNIEQMVQEGSSEFANIVVQLDLQNNSEIQRIYVEKNNAVIVERLPYTQDYISGTAESLYKCVEWGIKNYPAKHYAVFIWNHGSGPIDPAIWGKPYEAYLFQDGIKAEQILTNDISFKNSEEPQRGTAFNDRFQTYITNPELKKVFQQISTNLLQGEKLSLLAHDACYHGAIEVAAEFKDTVDFMVASEEVVLATGFNYQMTFKEITKQKVSPWEFAYIIALKYQKEYEGRFADYTLSAIDLSRYTPVEENINKIALTLNTILNSKEGTTFKKFLSKIRRNDDFTTTFYNPDLIDLGHFYQSLKEILPTYKPTSPLLGTKLTILNDLIGEGMDLLKKLIIKNVTGKNATKAHGLSIYFPQYSIHGSYKKLSFVQATAWKDFLELYLSK